MRGGGKWNEGERRKCVGIGRREGRKGEGKKEKGQEREKGKGRGGKGGWESVVSPQA